LILLLVLVLVLVLVLMLLMLMLMPPLLFLLQKSLHDAVAAPATSRADVEMPSCSGKAMLRKLRRNWLFPVLQSRSNAFLLVGIS
jgi:hypothetical protein